MIAFAALTVPALLTNASALLLVGASNRHNALKGRLSWLSMLVLHLAAGSFGTSTGLALLDFQQAAQLGTGIGLAALTAGVLLLSLDSALSLFRRPETLQRND